MKAIATDKTSTRTHRFMKIESAIDVLSEILGSRDEVIAVILEMLVSDCDFTDKQRQQILGQIKKLHGITNSQ